MTNSAYALLLTVQNILNNEVDSILADCNENTSSSCPDLVAVLSRLNDIYDLISNLRPNYYGIFTCPPNTNITSVGQIVPFGLKFGGSLTSNADGTINVPANCDFIIDFEINCSFSVSNRVVLSLINADSGEVYRSASSYSENYNVNTDYAEIYTTSISSGENGIRLAVKVDIAQTSGTAQLQQFNSFIKLVEV